MSWLHHTARSLSAALMVAGVAGCVEDASDESGSDASAGDSETQDQTAITPPDASPDCAGDDADASNDAPVNDAPVNDAAQSCTPSPPLDLASTQTVTVRISNAGDAEVWVVTRGALCSALGIERLSPSPEQVYLTGTSLSPDHHCCTSSTGCDFDGRGPDSYARLLPGNTMDLQWDARGVVADSCLLECAGMYHQPGQLIAFQPVAAGGYKVSVGYTDALEWDCKPDEAPAATASCSVGFASPAAREKQCEAKRYASAQFELQAGVDLVVPVTIP